MRKLTHQEIVDRQNLKNDQSRLPFCALLNSIRSLHNVGSIFRTADGVGLEKLWLCGITGYPPQPQIDKTALGAQLRVPWEYRKDIISVIKHLKSQGYHIILLEQTSQSIPYQEFKPQAPVCLIVGNEIEGVSDDIVSFCDGAVEIEMSGLKNSLNVSVAFGIVSYHIRHCMLTALNA